jgi:Tol biopolymer transport system component
MDLWLDRTFGVRILLCASSTLLLAPITAQTARPRAPRAPLTAEIVAEHALSPDGAWVAFLSDRDQSGTQALWGAPIDHGAPSVKLSGTLAPAGEILAFPQPEISDSNRVVYVARQAQDELFSVPVDGSAAPVELSATLVAGGQVQAFELDPQGARVIYRADQDVDHRVELYSVPIDGSQAPVKLTPGGGQVVVGDRISPDGSLVVYATGVTGMSQLWSQPIDGSAAAVLLGSARLDDVAFLTDEDNLRPLFTPDSTRVVFGEVQVSSGLVYRRAYTVPVDGSAAASRLHAVESIGSHAMTSDGTRVVYRTSEVYSVPSEGGMRVSLTDGPGYLAQPDGPTFDQTGLTGRGRFVLSASLTPDGVHVLVLVRDHPTLNLSRPWAPTC